MINANVRVLTIPAVDGAYIRNINVNANTSISFGKGEGGTVTGGTITITASAVNSEVFNTVTGISAITLTAPEPQTIIDTPVQRVELTLAGFTGTATDLPLTSTTWS